MLALVRAIRDSAAWLKAADNRAQLAQWLAEPRYVGVPAGLLLSAMQGSICMAAGTAPLIMPDFFRIDEAATIPQPRYGDMFYSRLLRWGQVDPDPAGQDRARAGFRMDLYRAAVGAEVEA